MGVTGQVQDWPVLSAALTLRPGPAPAHSPRPGVRGRLGRPGGRAQHRAPGWQPQLQLHGPAAPAAEPAEAAGLGSLALRVQGRSGLREASSGPARTERL